jgi:cyclopropane-fatty-acyl-phospholipid synthase
MSNSATQRELIQSRAQERGYADRLEVITADANTFHTANRYDRIVSIEMFEVRLNNDVNDIG